MTTKPISRALLIFSAIMLTAAGKNDVEKEPARPCKRIVHFPQDRSIGKYAIIDWDADSRKAVAEKDLRAARGDVEVPAGKQLVLMFIDETLTSNDVPIDLSPLDQLRPTDLQAFTVQPFARVTAGQIERLKRHTSLRAVALSGLHQIDDDCLAPLANLKSLEVLQFPEANITDRGLRHLVGLQKLRLLNLYGTKVTDAGLEHLKGLGKLKKLNLCNTKVTPEGVENLQTALPKCKISR